VKNECDLLLCIQVKMSEVDVLKVSEVCVYMQASFPNPSHVTVTYTGKYKSF